MTRLSRVYKENGSLGASAAYYVHCWNLSAVTKKESLQQKGKEPEVRAADHQSPVLSFLCTSVAAWFGLRLLNWAGKTPSCPAVVPVQVQECDQQHLSTTHHFWTQEFNSSPLVGTAGCSLPKLQL